MGRKLFLAITIAGLMGFMVISAQANLIQNAQVSHQVRVDNYLIIALKMHQ